MRLATPAACPLAPLIIIILSSLIAIFNSQVYAAPTASAEYNQQDDFILPKEQSTELIDLLDDLHAPVTTSTATSIGQGHRETKVLASKFLILTTGDYIKLYPLHLSSQQNSTPTATSSHYLIKPIEFDVNEPGLLNRLGNNSSFTRWLLEREALRAARSDGTKKLSILPVKKTTEAPHSTGRSSNVDDGDDELYNGPSGWRKPWISDVDYFFDSSFCGQQNSANQLGPYASDSCLVVVWLDKRNKFARFGSIDLDLNPIEDLTDRHVESLPLTKSPSTNTKDKVLWLNEFPPIDLCKRASEFDYLHLVDCDVSELAIQRANQAELHVVISSNNLRMDRILSGKLRPVTIQREQFTGLSLLALEACSDASKGSSSGLKNLNVDDTSGSWMFYLNKKYGSRIMALDLGPRLARSMEKTNKMNSPVLKSASQALVADTQLETSHLDGSTPSHITTMTIDTNRGKLYWLTDNNELFTSDLAGSNAESIGKLSAKPVIRSPGVMRVFHDTIFFSDTSRKSIMTYRLNQMASRNNRVSDHQVLLVETPTIYGFRLIDMDRIVADDTIEPERDESTSPVGGVQMEPTEEPSWFEGLFRASCRRQDLTQGRDVYELLTERAKEGCQQVARQSRRQQTSWGYYVCLFCLLIASTIAISIGVIWAVYGLMIILGRNKDTKMASDSNPIKYSV